MASTYISKTNGTSTNEKIFTFSAWVKRSGVNSTDTLISQYTDDATRMKILFSSDNYLQVFQRDGGSTRTNILTNRKFADPSAWYHVMIVCDNTQSSTDRVKIYINGVQETSFQTAQYPYSSTLTTINANSKVVTIGASLDDSGNPEAFFEGCMSHVHYCDGTSLAPTVFGSTDSVTGEWQINTSPSFTPGVNGFTILKDGNTITDQSANSNNWSLTAGTITKSEDNPSNVFCTINLLDNYFSQATFSNGNTKIQTGSSNESYTTSTLGASSGKFYCEMKLASSTSTNKTRVGITSVTSTSTSNWLGVNNKQWSYREDGRTTNNSSNYSGTWSSFTSGDIIMMAMDLDNSKLYYGKNGTWQNSGVPTSGSTGTGGLSLTAGETYFFAIGDETGGYSVCEFNFGNGYFGSTQISSAGTNASGIGIFEYDVPTGYTALSTKGLNL